MLGCSRWPDAAGAQTKSLCNEWLPDFVGRSRRPALCKTALRALAELADRGRRSCSLCAYSCHWNFAGGPCIPAAREIVSACLAAMQLTKAQRERPTLGCSAQVRSPPRWRRRHSRRCAALNPASPHAPGVVDDGRKPATCRPLGGGGGRDFADLGRQRGALTRDPRPATHDSRLATCDSLRFEPQAKHPVCAVALLRAMAWQPRRCGKQPAISEAPQGSLALERQSASLSHPGQNTQLSSSQVRVQSRRRPRSARLASFPSSMCVCSHRTFSRIAACHQPFRRPFCPRFRPEIFVFSFDGLGSAAMRGPSGASSTQRGHLSTRGLRKENSQHGACNESNEKWICKFAMASDKASWAPSPLRLSRFLLSGVL